MQANSILTHPSLITLQNPNLKFSSSILFRRKPTFLTPRSSRSFSVISCSCNFTPKNQSLRFRSYCISPSQGLNYEGNEALGKKEEENEKEDEEDVRVGIKGEELANQSIWNQIKEIVMFTGPATGIWICGPLMSLIDTAVIGQGSSVELAALGPATVVCDYIGYIFMFLSVATSNMVATSLARRDKNEVQHQISILLFIGLICGLSMFLFTRFFGSWALTAFSGPKNAHLVAAGNTYVQGRRYIIWLLRLRCLTGVGNINLTLKTEAATASGWIRGLAWPAVLVGWVAQSASLGMKDSWGPLKALAVATAVNGIGDVVLCIFLGCGIAGAAWATMVSQVVAAYMMIEGLNKKGYNAFAISIPSFNELLAVLALATPVFLTLMSKVVFYSLLIYFATSMGTHTVAAHQVMLQTFGMCGVWGEPLSQTAQSFMPELIYGVNRNLSKARLLLKSLVTTGATLGLVLGTIGVTVSWLFPNIFTPDPKVIQEMHKVLLPFFLALVVTPSTHSLEGTLLAGRDLRFISFTMSGCLAFGTLVLLLVSTRGYGLAGCWFALVGFQWTRFSLALQRLLSPNGILYSEDLGRYEIKKPRSL